MSILRPALNWWLRRTERPRLARAQDEHALRAGFEAKARLLFHRPRGVSWDNTELGGRPSIAIRRQAQDDARVLLYLHGGGYIFGSPRTHAAMVSRLCQEAGLRAVVPDYRKAPEHPFPAGLEDAVAAYEDLLAQGETRIILGGDSAGGGLTMALLLTLLAQERPLPEAVFALSPLTDLTFSGESLIANAKTEAVLPPERIADITEHYCGGHDKRDPRLSPIFGDFTGAPPVWLCLSDTEILADDARRLAAQMTQHGVDVELCEEHDLPHVWPIFYAVLPEARATLKTLARWLGARAA